MFSKDTLETGRLVGSVYSGTVKEQIYYITAEIIWMCVHRANKLFGKQCDIIGLILVYKMRHRNRKPCDIREIIE